MLKLTHIFQMTLIQGLTKVLASDGRFVERLKSLCHFTRKVRLSPGNIRHINHLLNGKRRAGEKRRIGSYFNRVELARSATWI